MGEAGGGMCENQLGGKDAGRLGQGQRSSLQAGEVAGRTGLRPPRSLGLAFDGPVIGISGKCLEEAGPSRGGFWNACEQTHLAVSALDYI